MPHPISNESWKTDRHTAGTVAKYNASSYPEAVVARVAMELPVEVNSFGSVGILYNGGAPAVIRDMEVKWE
ncbi:MAG: hypothetical protein R2778_07465 [Saprospiraceae bacterium]